MLHFGSILPDVSIFLQRLGAGCTLLCRIIWGVVYNSRTWQLIFADASLASDRGGFGNLFLRWFRTGGALDEFAIWVNETSKCFALILLEVGNSCLVNGNQSR